MGFFDNLKKAISGEPTLPEKPAKPRKRKKKEYQAPTANGTIVIEYLNYAGELKQFIGDPKSIVRKGNHFSVRVAPTFKRISLDRSKTRILKGVPAPAVMPAEPLPVRTTTADTSIIQYTNWEGIHKEFKIITGVVDDKGDYVRVRVSPTFKYITLKRTRIGNPEALFDATTTAPSREVAPTVESEAEPTVTPAPADTVNFILTGCGIATYDATHVLRDLRPDLGTFDLYSMLRNFPQTVAENMPLEQAEAFKKRLEDAGCTVELK
jgi:ribosomal protein L7/L12